MTMYNYIKSFKTRQYDSYKELRKSRLMQWRREPVVVRIERPTNLDRARRLGYRAKQGIIVVRTRIARGSRRFQKADLGRRPKRSGITRITPARSRQAIAETRANRSFPNLEVLNSYWIAQDGKNLWYEIILIDPHHPSIINDKKINWICSSKHKGRAYRGLTSAGRKHRGLRNKGRGAERMRRASLMHRR